MHGNFVLILKKTWGCIILSNSCMCLFLTFTAYHKCAFSPVASFPSACRHPCSRAPPPDSRRRVLWRSGALSRHRRRPKWRCRIRPTRSLMFAPSAWQKRWRCSIDWRSHPAGSPASEATPVSADPTLATRPSPSPWAIWSRWGGSLILQTKHI